MYEAVYVRAAPTELCKGHAYTLSNSLLVLYVYFDYQCGESYAYIFLNLATWINSDNLDQRQRKERLKERTFTFFPPQMN